VAIQINRREKIAIGIGGAAVCLFIVIQFIIFPIFDKRTRLRRALEAQVQTMERMAVLRAQYDAAQQSAATYQARLTKRQKGFTLFSFLDQLAGDTGLKGNVSYMRPSSSTQKNSRYKVSLVEMKLQSVSLGQLLQYLHRIETSPNMVNIRRISIAKAGKEDELITAILQAETMEI
jgi:general secretion pathway protein M